MSLKNLSIAAAATLIYEETQECTFYLDHKDLKRVVAGLGGIGTDSITGKTNLVVLGDTCEIHTVTGTSPYRRAVLTNDTKGAVIVLVDEAGMAAVHTRAAAFSPATLCHVGKRARLLGTRLLCS